MLALVAVSVALAWYITVHPMEPELDEARLERAGFAVGLVLPIGLLAIWMDVYIRFIQYIRRKWRSQD